ncbi:MAG: tyrosine-type recombinase/integrase [Clostridiales bacterium]|nr:tyrosine-type recombinase/integrase [Clostridiales bacterium]MCF8021299.1 tyrosine-type recombinase/integrase [Clostridiales bacterium]
MCKLEYAGPFRKYIKEHIELKQAIGYKYVVEAMHLKRFDQFTLGKYPNATCLNKEIVLDWCSKRPHEAQANQSARASVLRQFSKYLDVLGLEPYILPKGYYPKEPQYTPYIFSKKELLHFFTQTEQCHYSPECPCRHLIMPVFFRMIYLCGLRVTEARLLTVGDVDLTSGVLSIHHSKKDNSRFVPMSNSLVQRCRDYSTKVHGFATPEEYYFPALGGKPMTNTNVYHNFRRFLWQARISHGGRGVGPRIMDFRHTYAVHCLKKWTEQDKDLAVYLPMLRTYMGHDSFQDTAYYLRLTADVFPSIILKLQNRYPDVIPELEGDFSETN